MRLIFLYIIVVSLYLNYLQFFVDNNEANKLIMRSIKMDITTLDKYVKQTKTIKETNIILPKSREIDIINPQLK